MFKRIVLLILVLVLLFSFEVPAAKAHIGGIPFFRINGELTQVYPVEQGVTDKIVIPQDLAAKDYIVNEQLDLEVDKTQLPFTKETVDRLKLDWDYGDGERGDGFKNNHSYKNPGSYFLVIRASDGISEPQIFQSVLINILPSADYKKADVLFKVNDEVVTVDNLKTHFSTSLGFLEISKSFNMSYQLRSGSSKIKTVNWLTEDGKIQNGDSAKVLFNRNFYFSFVAIRVIDEQGIITDKILKFENLDKSEGIPIDKRVYWLGLVPVLVFFLIWIRRKNFRT